MLSRRHRAAHLNPALVEEALRLLATGLATDRLQASQLLAAAYALDEEQRLAQVPEADKHDGYEEPAAPSVDDDV